MCLTGIFSCKTSNGGGYNSLIQIIKRSKTMKKLKEFGKKNIKVLVAFVIGLMLSGVGVYAATYINSENVAYDNSSSGLSATNMQDALDEAYTNAMVEYECSNPGETSDNGYFCSVYNANCYSTTYITSISSSTTYYLMPITKYNLTILTTLSDSIISEFLIVKGYSNFAFSAGIISPITSDKFNGVYTENGSSSMGTPYHLSIESCKSHNYYWKEL